MFYKGGTELFQAQQKLQLVWFDYTWKQAGAELGQAQLKLGLGFTSTNLHQIDE